MQCIYGFHCTIIIDDNKDYCQKRNAQFILKTPDRIPLKVIRLKNREQLTLTKVMTTNLGAQSEISSLEAF